MAIKLKFSRNDVVLFCPKSQVLHSFFLKLYFTSFSKMISKVGMHCKSKTHKPLFEILLNFYHKDCSSKFLFCDYMFLFNRFSGFYYFQLYVFCLNIHDCVAIFKETTLMGFFRHFNKEVTYY